MKKLNTQFLKLKMSVVFLLIGFAAFAQSNELLDRSFWKTNPSAEEVETKINQGNDPAQFNSNAFDPMVYALLENASEQTLKFLLSQDGNEVNKITHDGRTYIFWAAYKGNLPFMKYLFEMGAKTDIVDDHGYSLLNFTARSGIQNQQLYDFIFAHGADATKEKNNDGANALLLLIPHLEKPEMIRYFETKGLLLVDTDTNGNGVFDYAAMGGNTEMLDWLIDQGASYKAPNKINGNAFHFAARGTRGHSNKVAVFDYLKNEGLDPNAHTNEGVTPLMIYAGNGKDPAVFEFLLANGADPGRADKNGVTALMIATKNNAPAVVDLFLEKGANPNATDPEKNTALFYLVQSFNPGNVQEFDQKMSILIKNNLDVSLPQNNGNTFYHLAANRNDMYLIQKANELGLDVNAKNNDGMTPLHIAAMKAGNDEILKYLIASGADKSIRTDFDESAFRLAGENELLRENQTDLKFLEN